MALIVIQARMSSTRLPGKSLFALAGRPSLGWVIRAALESQSGPVVVATSIDPSDDEIAATAFDCGVEVVRGPMDDVLSRFVLASSRSNELEIVRLTADCPLMDPELIESCVAEFSDREVDYLSTVTPRTLPRGLDVEVFSHAALVKADHLALERYHRAHVTSVMYSTPNRFRVAGLTFEPDASTYRVTLDTAADVLALEAIVAVTGDRTVSRLELIALLRSRPDIVALNAEVQQKRLEEG